jgi:hypothetical protein
MEMQLCINKYSQVFYRICPVYNNMAFKYLLQGNEFLVVINQRSGNNININLPQKRQNSAIYICALSNFSDIHS